MRRLRSTNTATQSTLLGMMLFLSALPCAGLQPTPAATAAFDNYSHAFEGQLAQQHRSPQTFLANINAQNVARLRNGELLLEQVSPPGEPVLNGAMLHHWRGTAFVKGANAADFESLMKDFHAYPRLYAPQVVRASVIAQQGNRFQASMRVRQRHVITVVMDTTYDVTFGSLDPQHAYSLSRSINVSEIDAAGTPAERVLSASEEHGFLWRLNTYWSCEESDGGLYLQIESITLTRTIPHGIAWAVQPFVESVPRESLEFTLRSTTNALRR